MDDLNLRFPALAAKLLWGRTWRYCSSLTLTPIPPSHPLSLTHSNNFIHITKLTLINTPHKKQEKPKMAPTPPTIVSLKQSFLAAQTRLLSQPLTPTRAWHSNNNNDASTEDSTLPEKAIDDALFKLNHRLQQHARRVYAPQATRHVAEQIDQLYWNAAEAATQGDRDSDEEGESAEGLNLGADLSMFILTSLPHSYHTGPLQRARPPLTNPCRATQKPIQQYSPASQRRGTVKMPPTFRSRPSATPPSQQSCTPSPSGNSRLLRGSRG